MSCNGKDVPSKDTNPAKPDLFCTDLLLKLVQARYSCDPVESYGVGRPCVETFSPGCEVQCDLRRFSTYRSTLV